MAMNDCERTLKRLNSMKSALESTEKAGSKWGACTYCFQLFGALKIAKTLNALPPEEIKR